MKNRHGNPVPFVKRIDIPPLWLAATLGVQFLVARSLPFAYFDIPGGGWIVVAGLCLIIWSAVRFHRERTPIHPRRKPTTLITDGPFAYSRNPIYLGMVIIAAGWAVILGSFVALLVVPLFMWLIQKRFILGEEYHIARALGDIWRDYEAVTRRWL